MYEIVFTRKASNSVKLFQKSHKEKLKETLIKLRENPFICPYKKINGETNIYRIRIGKYRVIYEVNNDRKRIVIVKIDKRNKVYEGW
ncbi:MAG: ParE toxin of type II toxin-antitoxin system, parDE [Candidatus Argoarchaeum ethanivorans]|uniref:ParE toxin of type II toxin-antitoxin system, parDE n=1 Tax=Candidatus Argoarchaeum ethanivorans TaxID=2608793 RepID=A0A811TDU2_9EURY|nr:MAG: ParE toxin of type II toxin-antitoxin system, parDE [Candidatus Argoarchaeum ethanivorans]